MGCFRGSRCFGCFRSSRCFGCFRSSRCFGCLYRLWCFRFILRGVLSRPLFLRWNNYDASACCFNFCCSRARKFIGNHVEFDFNITMSKHFHRQLQVANESCLNKCSGINICTSFETVLQCCNINNVIFRAERSI